MTTFHLNFIKHLIYLAQSSKDSTVRGSISQIFEWFLQIFTTLECTTFPWWKIQPLQMSFIDWSNRSSFQELQHHKNRKRSLPRNRHVTETLLSFWSILASRRNEFLSIPLISENMQDACKCKLPPDSNIKISFRPYKPYVSFIFLSPSLCTLHIQTSWNCQRPTNRHWLEIYRRGHLRPRGIWITSKE